jgi:hypothetical protein
LIKLKIPGRNKKISISLNIGTVIFGAIFVYLFVFLILCFSSNHVTYYQVTSGPLTKNDVYTGFVIRQEEIVTSDTSGYVHYYSEEDSKIKKFGPLYGTGTRAAGEVSGELSQDAKKQIKESVRGFAVSFDPMNYKTVSSLKYDISGKIVSDSWELEGYDFTSQQENFTLGDVTISTAPKDGVVVYSVDGYENFDLSDFSSEIMNRSDYNKEQLKTGEEISAGDRICKIVTSENWSLLIPLTPSQEVKLNSFTDMKVKFLKDGTVENAEFSIVSSSDGQSFGKLDLRSGMIRFIDDRYVDIELVTNTKTGLKIPISSICTKEFFTVPEEYVAYSDDRSDVGFMKEIKKSDGSVTSEFVSTTLYEHTDGKYYIDGSDFAEGDVIVLKNASNERYIIGSTASIEGVYCTNKGYAVFRKISIVDKNEEYCIAESGTRYGISQFDYIVLNASEVNEDEIVVK